MTYRKLKSAHSCRLCGRWLEGECNSDTVQRLPAPAREIVQAGLLRQMRQGHCDVCPPRVRMVRYP